jgi:hypothetical protein
MYETAVSDIQSGVSVSGNKITGTLKYLSTGSIVEDYGVGNFLALKFSNVDPEATSVKVGLEPSDEGLQELLGDSDMNAIGKITDKNTQKFRVETTDDSGRLTTQIFDLSGLEVLAE